jgi:hypothetical protein
LSLQLPLAEQIRQLGVLVAQDYDFGLIAAELSEVDVEASVISSLHHQVQKHATGCHYCLRVQLFDFSLRTNLLSFFVHQSSAHVSSLLVTFVTNFRLSLPAALGLPTPLSADTCPVFRGSRISVQPCAPTVSPAGQLQAVRLYRIPGLQALGDPRWQFQHAVSLASFLPDNLMEQTPKVIFQYDVLTCFTFCSVCLHHWTCDRDC